MPDLDTATTDELIDQLEKRHLAFVLVREYRPKTGNDKTRYRVSYAGGLSAAQGLLVQALADLIADGRTPAEDDDEPTQEIDP